jgi:predicted transcriptional regulator
MTKKGPLSKKEKTYIEENKSLAVEEIAEELDRSEASVRKHIATLKSEDKPQTLAGQLMARNEKYGATIMTQNASMAGDATKGKRQPSEEEVNVAKRHRGSIHKIKGD